MNHSTKRNDYTTTNNDEKKEEHTRLTNPTETQEEEEEEEYSSCIDNDKSSTNNNTTNDCFVQRIKRILRRMLQTNSRNSETNQMNRYKKMLLIGGGGTTLFLILFFNSIHWWMRKRRKTQPNQIQYNEKLAKEVPISVLLSNSKKGLVKAVFFNSTKVLFQLSSDENKKAWNKIQIPKTIPNFLNELLHTLSTSNCNVTSIPESFQLVPLLINASPFIYLALLYQMLQRMHRSNTTISYTFTNKNNKTTFADVAGVDEAQMELEEIVSYLNNPTPFMELGASIPKGVLLYGPPGNGKTLLARAVAGEANADYFQSCSGSDFVEIYVGQGAKRIRNLFTKARTEAYQRWCFRHYGSTTKNRLLSWFCEATNTKNINTLTLQLPTAVLFIDEIDALAKCRNGGDSLFGSASAVLEGNDEREQTLNALLTEMDGFHTPQQHFLKDPKTVSTKDVTIIVIAATNRKSVIDPALLRPGRFDRHVLVSYPNAMGREAILQVHSKNLSKCETKLFQYIADDEQTKNFTGAELKTLVNEAALLAVKQGVTKVTSQHFLQALEKVKTMKQHR